MSGMRSISNSINDVFAAPTASFGKHGEWLRNQKHEYR